MKQLIEEITKTEIKATVFIDNQSSIRLIKNPELHKRSKHIDIKYHFIRHEFQNALFNLEYVPTSQQEADVMTKPICPIKFENNLNLLILMEDIIKESKFNI